jgi:hypothetical protein
MWEELTEEAMLCRDLGHIWRPYKAERRPKGQGFIRTMRCRTCNCERRQYLDRFGAVSSNNYRYPAGYLVGGGFTREDRQELRLHQVTYLLDEGERRG